MVSGERCKSFIVGLGQRPSHKQFSCTTESTGAALVATVFVGFPEKKRLVLMHKRSEICALQKQQDEAWHVQKVGRRFRQKCHAVRPIWRLKPPQGDMFWHLWNNARSYRSRWKALLEGTVKIFTSPRYVCWRRTRLTEAAARTDYFVFKRQV